VRPLILFCLFVSLTFSPLWGSGLLLAAGIAREHHPWGNFKPGAWKLVRVITEKLDEKGLVTNRSRTDNKTTLLAADDDGVTLESDVVYEVAGIQYEHEPETLKEGFHGELLTQGLKIKETGTGSVVIEGRTIPCKLLELEFSGPASKTVVNIAYSPTVAPYILKRQSVTTDLSGNNSRSETTMEVLELDMPFKVSAQIQSAAFVRTIVKHPKGTTTTLAATSTAVPGGVIWYSCKELDKAGRLTRRSTLELVDYGLELEPERTGLFGRKRRGLFRKTFPLRQPP
jgi:hypothetical protein